MALLTNGSYDRSVGNNVKVYTVSVAQSELQNLDKQANMSRIREHETES